MKKAQKVALGLAVLIAVVTISMFILGRNKETTDDAQIEGHIVNVAPRVSGQVQALTVADNQEVKQGDLLFKLDTAELEARVTAAEADLSAARAGVEAGESDISAALSRLHLAEIELKRVRKLHSEGILAKSNLDAQQSQYDQAKAAYDTAIARQGSTRKGGSLGAALAKVQQAEAAYNLAKLYLSYAEIRAPRSGVVSRRSVELGQMVTPNIPVMALVDLSDVWVVANFKEDQLGDMRVGQKADVTIDSFGREHFDAEVFSIGAATGSKFALIPPDNASGNFVKVVQRIPVLLHLKNMKPSDFAVRPGMSAVVTVHTR